MSVFRRARVNRFGINSIEQLGGLNCCQTEFDFVADGVTNIKVHSEHFEKE